MEKETELPHETDLGYVAIKAEREVYLLEVVQQARTEMAPRNFAERHLVDEMAIAKWRAMRTVLMERAIYDCHAASPHSTPCADPDHFNQQVFHVANAHAADPHAVILAALSRLDDRFHSKFCSALRHFLALRRQNPFGKTCPVEPSPTPADLREDETETESETETNSQDSKEEPTCNPSR